MVSASDDRLFAHRYRALMQIRTQLTKVKESALDEALTASFFHKVQRNRICNSIEPSKGGGRRGSSEQGLTHSQRMVRKHVLFGSYSSQSNLKNQMETET